MSTFSSTSETDDVLDADYILIRQDGIDYKQSRETLVGAIPNARWLEDTTYNVGSEIIGSDNKKYYALNINTEEDPTTDDGTNWQLIERIPQVENLFKTNQNWNIIGSDGNAVPSSTSATYAEGEEIAAGIVAEGEVVMARTDGVVSGVGSYYREYEGVNFANSHYYGVKLETGVISQTGVTISYTGGNTRVTVNLASAGNHLFVGLSEKVGMWADINDTGSSDMITPVGVPLPWPTDTAPSGYAIMKGQSFDTTLYPQLYAAYPTGIIPDMQDLAIVGKGSSETVLSYEADGVVSHTHTATTSSTDLGTKTSSGNGSHAHTITGNVSSSTNTDNLGGNGTLHSSTTKSTSSAGSHTHTVTLGSHNHTTTIAATGNTENTIKNRKFNYIVRLA